MDTLRDGWSRTFLVSIVLLSVCCTTGCNRGPSEAEGSSEAADSSNGTVTQVAADDNSRKPQSGSGTGQLAQAIELARTGKLDDAVDVFAKVDWTGTTELSSGLVFYVTEQEFLALGSSDMAIRRSECEAQLQHLRLVARKVLDAGRMNRAREKAESRRYFTAVKGCGEFLTRKPGLLQITRMCGKALISAASKELDKP